MEKCRHSIKATYERVKSQIQKGADLKRAVRRGYDNACDYFEIMNKRILIQQRPLACLSNSVAHILQRELYTMGNTGLLRREAEMPPLLPHLGDSRHQKLRNSPFWPTPLFKSQLVKDGEDFLLKKAPLKILRVLDPTKTSPFVVPITRKEGRLHMRPFQFHLKEHWIINQEKSELKPTQVFSFVGYEYHLDSALVKPTQERWLKLQDLILHLKSKHVLTARCLMSLVCFTWGPFSFTSRSTADFLSCWTASFLGQKPFQHT